MDNKLQVTALLDSSKFDQQISELQRKIKNLRETGPNGALANLANTYNRQGDPETANRIQAFRQRAEAANRISTQNDLEKKERQLQRLLNLEERITKNIQERGVATKKELEFLDKMTERAAQLTGSIGKTKNALAVDSGGPGGAFLNNIKGIGSVISTIASLSQLYGNFKGFQAKLPGMQATRDVGIAQGANQYTQRALSGNSFEDIVFAPERAKAIDRSMNFYKEAQSAREIRAKTKGYGGLAMAGMGLAGIAATIATGGGALPFLLSAAALGGGTAGVMSEEGYYGLTGDKDALSKMTGKEALEEQEKYRLQEIMKDPRRYYQAQFLKERRGQILGIQRSAGMTDQEMFGEGGFIQRGGDQFSFAQRAGMAQEILGAGGNGSSASRLHILALQAQRNIGLTNSGQAMGRLSNYLNTQESEEAFVKILSKGVSIGLDKSEYREEQKDYIGQVTAIAQRLGGGEQMIASSMTAGMEGDISRRNVQRSAEQFENLREMLNETGGVSGAMKFALMSQDPIASKLKGLSKLGFQKMQIQDITEENPMMKEYYRQAIEGMSEEEKNKAGSFKSFVQRTQKNNLKALIGGYAPGEEILKEMEEYNSIKGTGSPEELERRRSYIQSQLTGLNFGGEQNVKNISNLANQYMGLLTGSGKEGKASNLNVESTLGLDQLDKAESRAESEALKEFGKNVENIFKQSLENAAQNLTNQLLMKEFNDKLQGGADSVQIFLEALKGAKSQNNTTPSNQTKPTYQQGHR